MSSNQESTGVNNQNGEKSQLHTHRSLSTQDMADVILSHQYRLSLPSVPSQSSFRVLALLFYKDTSAMNLSSSSKATSHLPPWVRQKVSDQGGTLNGENKATNFRTFIVGTNDEPGYMGGAICAERAALVQLRFVPSFEITKLVIATDSLAPIPCGMLCREFFAGHASVPWDLDIISTGCQCSRCGLRDEELFLQNTNECIDGYTEHSIPTLRTTIAELYPYPSPYTRLTSRESVALGEKYSESLEISKDLNGLQEKAKRLLELAIMEAKANVNDIHPIQFGAAAMLQDESIITSHQSSALEYGCTLDAVSQLVSQFKDEECGPVMLVQADQYGIAHAPFAPARSFLSEHGFGETLVLLHETPHLNDASESMNEWRLKEVRVSELASNSPDWVALLDDGDEELVNDGARNQKRKPPPVRETSQDKDKELVEGNRRTSVVGRRKRPASSAGAEDPSSSSELEDSSAHKEKLKIVSQDLLNKFNESKGSFSSELSQCVNDSARGLSFEEVYEKQDLLGEGGFAFVYRCLHKERRTTYAVKEVFSENYETSGQCMNHEIKSLKRLTDIPYIVRFLDVFKGPGTTHLIMEEMKGGDLLDRLYEKEVFSEEESRKISRRLLEALFFCHKKGIAHRDVKPENIVSIAFNLCYLSKLILFLMDCLSACLVTC